MDDDFTTTVEGRTYGPDPRAVLAHELAERRLRAGYDESEYLAAYEQAAAELAVGEGAEEPAAVTGAGEHAWALESLRKAGKGESYTEAEYLAAFAQAEQELGAIRSAAARGEIQPAQGGGFYRVSGRAA